MLPSREDIIECMARAIWEADGNKGATWDELLILKSKDGYLVAKTTFKITMEQAEAALNALLDSLPADGSFTIPDMDAEGNVYGSPRVFSGKNAEYYKELLNMKGK